MGRKNKACVQASVIGVITGGERMKKVFLHGSLGRTFKKEWEFDADSPSEVVRALFANEPEIEKYLINKEKDGIQYGVKKESLNQFIGKEDFNLKTQENIHVFPVPKGSGGFVLSLVVLAATTYASVWVNKKIAEAMERDESTLQAQTQSYLYNGQENRYEQGATVPLGYGRLRVGSNTISAAVSNYDYNSDQGKILNFNSGLYSLVPEYSKYYLGGLGPLGSAMLLNGFDGKSQFSSVAPGFKYQQDNIMSAAMFGVKNALYTTPRTIEEFRKNMGRGIPVVESSAIAGGILGFLKYYYDFSTSVDIPKLMNFVDVPVDDNHGAGGGNWGALINMINAAPEGNFPYEVKSQDALSSPLVCIQTTPRLETSTEDPVFFPITFATESDKLDYLPPVTRQMDSNKMFPIQIGQRWRGGEKANGLGWFRLESASVYKAIDLIGEGPIDGFSNTNGDTLKFSKTAETSPEVNSRYTADDYLQGVYLDGLPVKEILNKEAGDVAMQDAYNINEFDIDVGMNKDGFIGSNNQDLLEPQYLFTATTKDINKTLFGPRNSFDDIVVPIDVEEFKSNTIYALGSTVLYEGNNYEVVKEMGQQIIKGTLFGSQGVYYTDNGPLVNFHQAQAGFDGFSPFNFSKGDYEEGVSLRDTYLGETNYYQATSNISSYQGVWDADKTYVVGDYAQSTQTVIHKVTGGMNGALSPAPGDPLQDIAEGIYGNDPSDPKAPIKGRVEILKEEGLLNSVSELVIDINNELYWKEINPTPGTPLSALEALVRKLMPVPDPSYGLFSLFDIAAMKKNKQILKGGEEYYLAHSVINPLVEEVYIALQVDELMYLYEGDTIRTTYKVGAMLGLIIGALSGIKIADGAFKESQGLATSAEAISASKIPVIADLGALLETKAGLKKTEGLKDMAIAAVIGAGFGGMIGSMLEFGIGTKQENSGETWPNRARFRIKYGNEGEIMYSTDVFVYGVASSPYRKDVKIYLPPNPQNKKRVIKVYKLNRELNPVAEGETAFRYKQKMSLAAITEITPATLNYPNSVVIGTRVNARDVASLPTRTYDLKLKKVAIPNTYNPKTKRYTSETWNGLFIGQASKEDDVPDSLKYWTDNPAWCLYDLISDTRYGGGRFGIKPGNIDRWTLYRLAKYCDEEVPTGCSAKFQRRKFKVAGEKTIKIEDIDGAAAFKQAFSHVGKKIALFYKDKQESIQIVSVNPEASLITLEINPIQDSGECAVSIDYPLVEPRYTLNAMLLSSQNAFQLINEVAQIFRAYAYWAGGAINFFQDEKKDPVMLFANNNISKEGFSYASTPKTSRTNSCKIQYTDKYSDFISKMEYSEDTQSIRENNIIEQKIDGFGITSPGQARRAADFLVKTANMETELVSFDTSAIGSYLRPGDIISVVDNKRTVGRFAGKVLNIDISGDGKMAEIDIDFPIRTIINENDKSTWKDINIYSISGNQTIESLDSLGAVSDSQIEAIRTTQIGQYVASNLSNNDTKIKIINNPYSFVTGELSWVEALRDAEARGGILATVNNITDQSQVQAVLPSDSFAWLGGYYREMPAPEKFVWQQPQACTTDEITYFDWGEGFPNVGEPIETDLNSGVVTDAGEWSISSDSTGDGGNYIAVSGSNDVSTHGDWVTISGNSGIGYILETKANNSLLSLNGIAGTTFSIDDSVNFSEPKTYRVININEKTRGTFGIQGVEYDKDKFDNIEKNSSLKEPRSPVIFTEKKLDPPSDLRVGITTNSDLTYGLSASWTRVIGASRYRAQFFNGTELLSTFEVVNNNSETTQSIQYNGNGIIEGQAYYARVYPLIN